MVDIRREKVVKVTRRLEIEDDIVNAEEKTYRRILAADNGS